MSTWPPTAKYARMCLHCQQYIPDADGEGQCIQHNHRTEEVLYCSHFMWDSILKPKYMTWGPGRSIVTEMISMGEK